MQLPPFKWPLDQRQWEQVYRKITAALAIVWDQIDATGSSLTDLTTRNHADLQNINTANYTHLTAANHTDLTDAGDSALHYHAADRARANHTGTQALSTISDVTITAANLNALDDGANTTLHFHDSDRARANHTGEQAISTVTGLQTALDGKVDENVAITPATKTKVTYDAKGLVTAGTDATTADVNDSVDRRYVTDAQRTVIQNTSGTNTGDVTLGTANGLSLVGQALSLQAATDSVPGALTAADHTSYSAHVAATGNPHGLAIGDLGIKHQRVTTGSIAAGSTALVTLTWSSAFADANYTVSAQVQDSTSTSLSLSVVHIESVSASAVAVRVLNNALGSLTGTLHVTAIHD